MTAGPSQPEGHHDEQRRRRDAVLQRQLAEAVRASVESGDYGSDREAVEDAVRLWSAARRGPEPDLATLQKAWADGKASGLHGRVEFDALRDKARRRSRDGSIGG